MTGECHSQDRTDALKLVVDYRRTELNGLQARLDRADGKAATTLSATVAAATLAITGLTALERPLPRLAIIFTVLGGLFLLAAFVGSILARDTADEKNFLGKLFGPFSPPALKDRAACQLDLRAQIQPRDIDVAPDPSSAATLTAIAKTLSERLDAGQRLVKMTEFEAQLATFVLAFGVAFLAGAAGITISA